MQFRVSEMTLTGIKFVQKDIVAGADQFLSDRRGADFPRGVHLCATKGAAWAAVFLATLS